MGAELVSMLVSIADAPGGSTRSSPDGGTVALGLLGAAVVVALWRVVLRLLLVALVTFALVGVVAVLGVMVDQEPGQPAGWGTSLVEEGPV